MPTRIMDKGLTNSAGLDEVSADGKLGHAPHSYVYRKIWGKTGRYIEHAISIEMVISCMHLTRLPAIEYLSLVNPCFGSLSRHQVRRTS